MNKERLLKLADFIEPLPATHFDYSDFGVRIEDCGSTACAMGWAPEIPAFRKLGADSYWSAGKLLPKWQGKPVGWYELAEYLFEVDRQQFRELFANFKKLDDGATAAQVAQHIREYVRDAA